jgi:uncharacterized protein YceK
MKKIILLAIIMMLFAGCSSVKNTTKPVQDNKKQESFSQEDPTAWPRFVFEDLGISLQLPFSTSSVIFLDKNCTVDSRGERMCYSKGKNEACKIFRAFFVDSKEASKDFFDNFFISSASPQCPDLSGYAFNLKFYQKNNQYYFSDDPTRSIRPLIIQKTNGREGIIVDLFREFTFGTAIYEQSQKTGFPPPDPLRNNYRIVLDTHKDTDFRFITMGFDPGYHVRFEYMRAIMDSIKFLDK